MKTISSIFRILFLMSFWIALMIVSFLKICFNWFPYISWWWICSPFLLSGFLLILLFTFYFISKTINAMKGIEY